MKHLKITIITFIVLSLMFAFIPNLSHATNVSVTDQDSLVSAIENANNGDIIELSENIILIRPVGVTGKAITINGNGHSISRVATNWSPNGEDGSLITAGGVGTTLTLMNITLKDAQKYGVQSYNGAHVILDNVTVTNNGYGGVLVNAGTVEIKSLNLGRNGQYNNNGIEIGKGSTTGDNTPTLIMNGTITSSEKENVVFIAENDNLSEFAVKNADTTTDKIFVKGDKVVITDNNQTLLYESNSYAGLDIVGDVYVEPTPEPSDNPAPAPDTTVDPNVDTTPNENTTPEPDVTPTQEVKDQTPKTGAENFLPIAIFTFTISFIILVVLTKKEFLY